MAKDSRVREEMLPNPYIIPLHARPSSSIFSSVKSLAPSIWKCSFSVLISVRRVQRSAGKRLTTSSLWRRWTLVCSACDVNSPALADFSPTKMSLDFPGGSMVKNLPAIQKPLVQSLGQEDLLEEKVATHSSILAWRIPWTEEPGRLQSMASQSDTTEWLTLSLSVFINTSYCLSFIFNYFGERIVEYLPILIYISLILMKLSTFYHSLAIWISRFVKYLSYLDPILLGCLILLFVYIL